MNSSKFYETYNIIKDNADLKSQFSDEDWQNILDALLFTSEYYPKYKVGQEIEFSDKYDNTLGKIVVVRNDSVEVVCRNGEHKFPPFEDIIQIIE